MEDRRHVPRTRCFKGATIKTPGQTVACIVRNVSAEGAGLQLSYSVILPAQFDLNFDTGQRCATAASSGARLAGRVSASRRKCELPASSPPPQTFRHCEERNDEAIQGGLH